MSFFEKIFKNILKPSQKEEDSTDFKLDPDTSVDELFVKNFIHKGGKFLYCSDQEEMQRHLVQVLGENEWNNVIVFDQELEKLIENINSAKTSKLIPNLPFLTDCECLIAHDGSIMFSSKQLSDKKLKDLPNQFIVVARTSQIVKDTREGISGIRRRSEKNAATIISSIKDFTIDKTEADFMSYGHTNSKTLYLLLLEDL